MSGEGERTVAQNRRARHDYFLEDNLEAGIVLSGSEIKSLRVGSASVNEAYAQFRGDAQPRPRARSQAAAAPA